MKIRPKTTHRYSSRTSQEQSQVNFEKDRLPLSVLNTHSVGGTSNGVRSLNNDNGIAG